MPYSIICYTKILTLAIATFLFILGGVLYEFAMVPSVYILLSPQKEQVHSSSRWYKWTDSVARSSKRFTPLSAILLLWQGYCWKGENTNKEFNCAYSVYNLTKYQVPL